MAIFERFKNNPILTPNRENFWEREAAFNGSVTADLRKTYLLYRAMSGEQKIGAASLQVSSVGIASSGNGVNFGERRLLFGPEYEWEKFGCEDPRVTKLGGKYYIFYTALSRFPFTPDGIRVGVAITGDLKKIDEKHPVTPFNAKAMALFPEKIGGKYAVILTANTDNPPAKVGLALAERIEDFWSPEYWNTWYATLGSHVLHLERSEKDQVEVGAPPLKTKWGWLLMYSYIENYFTPHPVFTVSAVLLDLNDPLKVLGKTERTLLIAEEEYERYGKVPDVVFPSGAMQRGTYIYLYYGAADTTCCLAKAKLGELIGEMLGNAKIKLTRFEDNPVIKPFREHPWESKATFNPAAIYENGKTHIIYRAMSEDNISVFGYAASADGLHIEERSTEPIYVPREEFELKRNPGGNSGCEDPRITKIGDTFYMCYTAYDGKNPPRVALTSIRAKDFLKKNWRWATPVIISPPGVDDKDAALFPKKINGKYTFLHRLGQDIWIDSTDDLEFKNGKQLRGSILMSPRAQRWDSKKIGVAAPPIETTHGWLLLYHGISKESTYYRVKAALLDLRNPGKVLARTTGAILEPEMDYEKTGQVKNVVFPCGATVVGKKLFVYYGGADKFVGVASMELGILIKELHKEEKKNGTQTYHI